MSDPFFEYFKKERKTTSQSLYGEPSPRYKTYERCKIISLPEPDSIPATLGNVLQKRHSTRTYASTPLTLSDISSLLYWSIGAAERDTDTRSYPSGGGLYPIEPYIICLNVEKLPRGVYHYNIRDHTLECISDIDDVEKIVSEFGYPFVADAGAVLCLSFIKSRSIQKYGGLAYKLGILEAGHIGQNVYMVSGALGLACCALGGGDTDAMHNFLGIDGGNEHITYALTIGIAAETY